MRRFTETTVLGISCESSYRHDCEKGCRGLRRNCTSGVRVAPSGGKPHIFAMVYVRAESP